MKFFQTKLKRGLESNKVTYNYKVSASRDPVLDNRKKDRLKPVP